MWWSVVYCSMVWYCTVRGWISPGWKARNTLGVPCYLPPFSPFTTLPARPPTSLSSLCKRANWCCCGVFLHIKYCYNRMTPRLGHTTVCRFEHTTVSRLTRTIVLQIGIYMAHRKYHYYYNVSHLLLILFLLFIFNLCFLLQFIAFSCPFFGNLDPPPPSPPLSSLPYGYMSNTSTLSRVLFLLVCGWHDMNGTVWHDTDDDALFLAAARPTMCRKRSVS